MYIERECVGLAMNPCLLDRFYSSAWLVHVQSAKALAFFLGVRMGVYLCVRECACLRERERECVCECVSA